MKICLYTNTAFPVLGGQEVVVDELARQYQDHGHDVVVFCPEPPHSLPHHDDDLPYRVERHPRFVSTRWFVNWYELALKRLHRSFPYDLIHCHNVYPNGYLAARHRLRGGPPVFITSHGGDVREDNPRFKKPGLLQRHRLAVQQADALVSIGPFTDQGFLRLGAQPHKLHSISNGVHVQQFARNVKRPESVPSHLKSRQFILSLGRLAYRKGVDVLLQAADWFQQQQPGQLPQLVICGDGPERESLQQQARALNLYHQTTFMGSVQGETKRWLLQNAMCLTMPTREWEAFPMVLLEGFAAACPVIASDAPGLAGLVVPGHTGWVVPRNQPRPLAEALAYVHQHQKRALVVGKNGQEVAHRHDWQLIAQQHLDLFENYANHQSLKLRLAA